MIDFSMFPIGWNALHCAVQRGDEAVVRSLLSAGATAHVCVPSPRCERVCTRVQALERTKRRTWMAGRRCCWRVDTRCACLLTVGVLAMCVGTCVQHHGIIRVLLEALSREKQVRVALLAQEDAAGMNAVMWAAALNDCDVSAVWQPMRWGADGCASAGAVDAERGGDWVR